MTPPLGVILAAVWFICNWTSSYAVAAQPLPQVPPPLLSPAALISGTKTRVTFSVEMHDQKLMKIKLEHQVGLQFKAMGKLRDNGRKGDMNPNDGFYSKSKKLLYSVPGTEYFRIAAYFDLGVRPPTIVYSDIVALEVVPSGIPVDVIPSDPAQIIPDPDLGEIVCDEVIVQAAEAVSPVDVIGSLQPFGTVVGRVVEIGIYQLHLSGACSPGRIRSTITDLEALPEVATAFANAITHVTLASLREPNDTHYPSQKPHFDAMSITPVWRRYTTGSTSIPIAVVDSGVNYNHPDLLLFGLGGRVQRTSWNISIDEPFGSGLDTYGDGHGTAVAGVIGARTDNAFGVSGVTWLNPIIPIRIAGGQVGPAGLSFTNLAIISGISRAVAAQAKVINVSVGGKCSSATDILAPIVFGPVVNFATGQNRLIVASAGNDNCSLRHLGPSAVDAALSVGASNLSGSRWVFGDPLSAAEGSNYGSSVDIFADGVDIPSLNLTGTGDGTKLVGDTGTSISTPFVAGAAALLWSLRPEASAATIRDTLVANADRISNPAGYGYPDASVNRLNLLQAAEALVGRCGNAIAESSRGEQCDGIDDAQCSGQCRSDCTCPSAAPTPSVTPTPVSAISDDFSSYAPGQLIGQPAGGIGFTGVWHEIGLGSGFEVFADQSVGSISTDYFSNAGAGVGFASPINLGSGQLFIRYTHINLDPSNPQEGSRLQLQTTTSHTSGNVSLGAVMAAVQPPTDRLGLALDASAHTAGGTLRVDSGITSASGSGRHVLVGLLDAQWGRIAIWVDPDASDYYDPHTGDNSADAVTDWGIPAGGLPDWIGYGLIRNVDDQFKVDDVMFGRTWSALGILPDVIAGPVANPANDHTYYILDAAPWTTLEAEAQALGGHLVTINDASEDNWIFNNVAQLAPSPGNVWIGLNDISAAAPKSASSFEWSSGEPSTYRNWRCGESGICDPNYFDTEFCVLMIGPGGDYGQSKWVNIDCASGLPGIAEVP